MMNCTICEKDVQPTLDLGTDGRVLSLCPTCKTPLGSGLSATDQPEPQPRQLDDRVTIAGVPAPKGGVMVRPLPAGPVDLVEAAKLRLAAIDKELERLDALQREQRKLRAMIQAADSADVEDNLALSVRRSLAAPLPLTEAAE